MKDKLFMEFAGVLSIERPSFHEVYMNMAREMSRRAQDKFLQVGSVAVDSKNRLICASYNGWLAGYEPSFDYTLEENRELKNKLSIHSEVNLLSRCAPNQAHTIYLTSSPCKSCSQLICAKGVQNVIFAEEYHREQDYKFIFQEYGVKCNQWDYKLNKIVDN